MSEQTNTEEAKINRSFMQNGKQKAEIPESVAQYYSKYRNTSADAQKKQIMGSLFEIDSKYDVIDAVGQGAHGCILAARDKTILDKDQSFVCIKKIEKAFEHKVFAQRTIRELKILRLLQHENITNIKTIFLPKSREEFEDIYLCTELMETDLASVIKSSQPLSDEHVQFFLYQILRGLKYMHSAGIIHRDLKPRNLLVNSNCDLKICDFGLSRTVHVTNKTDKMSDYVATRWYRSPELLLETKVYGPAIDMWSLGCIFAELLNRKPFFVGTDTKHQLELIFDMIGTPSEEDIILIPKPRHRKHLRSLPVSIPKSFDILFPKANPQAVDLLKKMLVFSPQDRITAEEALKHPYLQDLHYPEDEPTREPVPSIEFEFEKYNLSLQQLKDLIYEEILLYHFEDFRKEYVKAVLMNKNPFEAIIVNENAVSLDDDA